MKLISPVNVQAEPKPVRGAPEGYDAVLAIDIGGTTLKGATIDQNGTVIARCTVDSFGVAGNVLSGVIALGQRLRSTTEQAGLKVSRIGLASPGIVDSTSGTVRYAPNLQWKDLPLRRLVEDTFHLEVVVEHDARSGAWAERAANAANGHEYDNFAFVPIGTGVSAALVSAGSLITGFAGGSGELGHISMDRKGELCVCGQNGCVEAYASAPAIASRYRRLGGSPALSTPEIARSINTDQLAALVWRDAVNALAHGISSLSALFDPAVVVIGGGVSAAGPQLLDPLRAKLAEYLSWREAPRVTQSILGAQAGLVGAALLGWGLGTKVSSNFVHTANNSLAALGQGLRS